MKSNDFAVVQAHFKSPVSALLHAVAHCIRLFLSHLGAGWRLRPIAHPQRSARIPCGRVALPPSGISHRMGEFSRIFPPKH